MKRIFRISGCTVLVIAGVVLGAVIEPWPLVWLCCYPIAYAGALGLYNEIMKKPSEQSWLQRER